jgi:hypothetical protein
MLIIDWKYSTNIFLLYLYISSKRMPSFLLIAVSPVPKTVPRIEEMLNVC